MAPENQGGLTYNINIGGDWESKLSAFEARLGALDAKSKRVSASGGGSASNSLAGQDVIAKKLLALENQLTILRSERVSLKQAEVNLTKRLEAMARTATSADEKQLAVIKQQDAFEKERVRSAQRLNKELTQAAEARQRETAALLKQDMIKRSKETMQQAKATEKNAEALRKSAEYNDINLQAEKRLLSSARELAIKRAQITQLTKDGSMSERAAAERVGVTSAQAKQLGLNMWDAEHAARQFLFTFRRLVGILAVFTLARQFAQAIGSGVKEMIRMNSELESTKNSISTLISSVGRIYNAQGKLVTGQEAFTAAAEMSDDIVKQLQKDAIGSVATFESLTQAFQVAVGPGLTAGLDIKQISEVSKRLVEGAVAMKVPLDQMSEEIRSILQGTTTSKNTRLVSLFGGSAADVNQQIRQAKEAGTFYEFLMQKLKGVSLGATAAASSMAVLKADLKDTTSLLAQEGGLEYFTALKDAIFGLRNVLAVSDPNQGFIFNPEALQVVKEVSGALANLINTFRVVIDTQQNLNLLSNVFSILSDAIRALLPVVVAVMQGILTGVNAVLAPIRMLISFVRALAESFGFKGAEKTFINLVKYITAALVASILLGKVWAKILIAKNILTSASSLRVFILSIVAARKDVMLLASGTSFLSVLLRQGLVPAIKSVAVAFYTAVGPVGIILALVGLLISATGVWSFIMQKYTNSAQAAEKSTKNTSKYLAIGADEIKKGAKTAKEWADELKEVERNLETVKSLKGLEGSAKELVSSYTEAVEKIRKEQDPWKIQQKNAEDALKAIQANLAATEAKLGAFKKGVSDVGIGLDWQNALPVTGLNAPTGGTQTANKQVLKDLSAEQLRLSLQAQDAAKALSDINAQGLKELQARIKVFEEENPLSLRKLQLAKDQKENELAIAQAGLDGLDTLTTELALLESKKEILKSIALLDEERGTLALKTLNAEIAARKADFEAGNLEESAVISLLNVRDELVARQLMLSKLNTAEQKKLADQMDIVNKKLQDNINLRAPQQQVRLASSAQAVSEASMQDAKPAVRELAGLVMRQKLLTAETALEDQKYANLLADKRNLLLKAQGTGDASQILEAERAVQDIRNEYLEEATKREAQALSLRKDTDKATLQASQKFVDGVELGIRDFIQQTPAIGEAVGASIKSALDGVAGAFGSAFKEYIRTGENVSAVFYNALGDVFLNLAEEFATNVAKQMISALAGEALTKFLGMGAANAPLIAATTANTAAITGLTAAMGGNVAATTTNAAATTGNAAATTANTGSIWAHAGTMLTHAGTMIAHAGTMVAHGIAVTFNTLATLANSAMLAVASALQMVAATIGSFGSLLVVAAVTAQTVILGSLLIAIVGLLITSNVWLASILFATVATGFFNKGGLVPKAFAKGGSVAPKGYALGGGIPRPANVPASDTVPAWLTPGEYVLPVPLVKQLGVGFLEKLRKGAIAPSTFHETASYLKTSSAGVRSFATGGAVAGGGTSAAVSSSDRSVNVAFFDDRKAMNKWAETTQGETAILRVMRKNAHRFK